MEMTSLPGSNLAYIYELLIVIWGEKVLINEWPFFPQIFRGNSHDNEIVKQVLIELARARIIRVQPVDYHMHKALRVEVYGTKIPAGLSVFCF